MIFRTKLLLSLALLSLTLPSIAQEKEEAENKEFKPEGKIIVQSFFDYSTGLGDNHNEDGFDVTRAFLGYNYKFTPTIEAQVIIDGASGRDAKGNLDPALRNAFVKWQDHGFTLTAGLIELKQYSLQTTAWKHRYVLNTFQGVNKMGFSTDAGITAEYQILPKLSVDAGITNGEGYKNVNKNGSTKYDIGATFTPSKNWLFRAYADYYNESEKMRPENVNRFDDQYVTSFFGFYENNRFSLGAEYSKMFNRAFAKGQDTYGVSFFSTVNINKKWNVYGRYETETSSLPLSAPQSWQSVDSQLMLFGVEFKPIEQIKISPNFRNHNPDRSDSEQFIFINAEFKL